MTRPLATDTAEICWLCERGELCHVHDPAFRHVANERETERDELVAVVISPEEMGDTDA